MRLPVAAKIALHSAGAKGGTPGSPTPLGGVSMIDVPGMPFHDPEADEALFAALRETLDPRVEAHWLDLDVNDERFALALADRLHELRTAWEEARR